MRKTLRPKPGLAHARRRGFSRKASVGLAVGVAIAFAVILGVFWLRGPQGGGSAKPQPVAPPTLPTTPGSIANGSSDLPGLGRGEEFFVQFVDRSDPTRLAGEITANRSTPLPERRYQLEQPRAWFFLRDGRSVHVQAATGNIKLPQRGGQPDDGRLEGTVLIRVYAPRHDAKRPDIATEKPTATITTPRMSVDMVLGQLDVPDAIEVKSEGFEYAGAGVTAQFDTTAQRIEMVHVRSTDHLVVRSTRATRQVPTSTTATKVAAATPPTTPRELAPTSRDGRATTTSSTELASESDAHEVLYALTATGPVRIEQGANTLLGSELRAWSRLLDNQLPARTRLAIDEPAGGVEPQPQPPPASIETPTPTGDPSTGVGAVAQASSTPVTSPASTTPIIARWDGPLIVRRMIDAPMELARDDLFVRVVGDAATRPLAVDLAEWKTTVEAESLEYAVTRRQGAIESPAGRATIVARGTGTAKARRVEVDLPRSIVRFPAGGELQQEPASSAPATQTPASLLWTGVGEFELSREAAAGAASARQLTHARVIGNVVARSSPEGSLASDELAIAFAPNAGGASGTPQPRELTALGGVRVRGSEDESLTSDTLRVLFEVDNSNAAQPRTIIARGNVVAAQQDQRLACNELEATIARKVDGVSTTSSVARGSSVADLRAHGDVRFTGKDGVEARAFTLTAQPAASTVQLHAGDTTKPGEIASIASPQGVVAGEQLKLDLEKRTIAAVGPGTLRTSTPGSAGEPARMIEAAWTGGANFDEVAGSAVIRGGASVDARTGDALSHDSLAAPTLELTFDKSGSPTSGSPSSTPSISGQSLALRTVRATSDATSPTGVEFPVKVHVRRFAPSDLATPETLGFLECSDATMDIAHGTMRVSGAGKLLTSTRGATAEPAATPQAISLSGTGDAMFTWKESLVFDHSGEVTMLGGVRLVRRAPSVGSTPGELSELECTRLVANFDPATPSTNASGGSPSFAMAGKLRQVTASEGVWTRSAGKELTCDRLVYDIAGDVVDADGGLRLVTVASADGSPTVTARKVRWQVATGRVDVIETGSISGPR